MDQIKAVQASDSKEHQPANQGVDWQPLGVPVRKSGGSFVDRIPDITPEQIVLPVAEVPTVTPEGTSE